MPPIKFGEDMQLAFPFTTIRLSMPSRAILLDAGRAEGEMQDEKDTPKFENVLPGYKVPEVTAATLSKLTTIGVAERRHEKRIAVEQKAVIRRERIGRIDESCFLGKHTMSVLVR